MNDKHKKPVGLLIALCIALFAFVALLLRFLLFVDYDKSTGRFFTDMNRIETPLDEWEDGVEQKREEYYYGNNN